MEVLKIYFTNKLKYYVPIVMFLSINYSKNAKIVYSSIFIYFLLLLVHLFSIKIFAEILRKMKTTNRMTGAGSEKNERERVVDTNGFI